VDNRLTNDQLEQLLEVGRSIVSELDLDSVLGLVLDAGRRLTGAAYAALGILDEEKTGLDRFLNVGIDEEKRHQIGPLPRGRGVLGELIRNPRPLRLADVGAHTSSYGFPPGHPPMRTFLGTPILIRGEAWGNLYLTEKEGGAEFDESDEQLVVVLAAWAAIAVENARLYDGLDRRHTELERALGGLEASGDIARMVAADITVDELLALIAKRGRAVADAVATVILLSDGEELTVAAAAGDAPEQLVGTQVADYPLWHNDLLAARPDLCSGPALTANLEFKDRARGVLLAVRRPDHEFDPGDRQVLESFAASAATTITVVRAAEAEKMQLSIDASERERRRWARELHDETLQELGALRFVLESAGAEGSGLTAELRERAIEHVDRGIRNLQGLITELRPAVLDELGIEPAIDALARQSAERAGVEIEVDVEIPANGAGSGRLEPKLEALVYRLLQEAVNNAIKHAEPEHVSIAVGEAGGTLEITVIDDGSGFDQAATERSFGLVGMEERVSLAGGKLAIDSTPGRGTTVRAEIPMSFGAKEGGEAAAPVDSDSAEA
jgi:signal transduction histidine kinase